MAGRVAVARAVLQAPTRPSRCCWGRVRRSRWASAAAVSAAAPNPGPACATSALSAPLSPPFSVPVPVRCRLGAGVGGGVHDGEEVFVLVGGGEDFEVVEAAAGAAEEGALAVAEFFFGGFGAVLVDGVGPAVGDAGQEVVVVLDGSARQGVFHPRQGLCRGDVADAVQGGGDDGSGAGGDGPGCQGGGGFFAGRGHGLAGDPGAGQDGGGEGEAAAGFRGADP